jgi:ribose-phosphate pyrophosphokinase
MKLITGNANRPLAEAVASFLGLPLTQAHIKRFSDQEVSVEILENVRGEDVFMIQSTSYPANDHLMELLVTLDALRRGSARRIRLSFPITAMRDKTVKQVRAHQFQQNWSPT